MRGEWPTVKVTVYRRRDRANTLQSSFMPETFDFEEAVAVAVPEGSALVGSGDLQCLRTPSGQVYTASDVLCLCESAEEGFGFA
jgi:hypothetical protein